MCCLLDGAALNGHSVRLRRPKDYVFDPNLADSKERPASETTGGGGANGPNTIFIGNLPPNLAEPQIRELLETFGPLKIFKMIRDSMGASRGFGFVEYVNPEVTDAVIQGLNGMELGDRKIAVQHAQQGMLVCTRSS